MTTPEKITSLLPNEIFVFGSNLAGRHGLGAAKVALKFGAKLGYGVGHFGQTYAIPTKDNFIRTLPLEEIELHVHAFKRHASQNPGLTFLVTPIGCGLAGYNPRDIAPMFKDSPPNAIMPESFLPYL